MSHPDVEQCLHLRPATPEDYAFMQQVGHAGLRPHVEPLCGWDQAEHERAFFDAFDPSLQQVIEVEGEPVGYLHLEPAEDHMLLAGIYLREPWQNRGVGGALVEAICARCDAAGVVLRLCVHRGSPAERLYARHGFVVETETATKRHMIRQPASAPDDGRDDGPGEEGGEDGDGGAGEA